MKRVKRVGRGEKRWKGVKREQGKNEKWGGMAGDLTATRVYGCCAQRTDAQKHKRTDVDMSTLSQTWVVPR